MFEAMIMNKELNNPMYRFLFDNQSPEHIYYRWKLFSILQGDSPTKWKTVKFKMFVGGSIWKPPQCHKYTMSAAAFNANKQPVPQVETPAAATAATPPPAPSTASSSHSSSGTNVSSAMSSSTAPSGRKNVLSNRQRDKLEDMLRDLTPERAKIARCMVFCVNHADCAEEVVECIAESLSILETPLQVKVARLYLVSDILHNCSVKVPNVSYYRRGFQKLLPDIFNNLSSSFKAINARMKAENFRKQVLRCLAAWMDWAVYTPDFLFDLENVFLGHGEKTSQSEAPDPPLTSLYPRGDSFGKTKADLDGAPLDVDGVPLKAPDFDGVPIRSVDIDGVPLKSVDIDGVPLSSDDIDGAPMDSKRTPDKPRDKDVPHVASKWDRPDWERIEEPESAPKPSVKEDSPSRAEEPTSSSTEVSRITEIDESRRRKLREIELKVAEYAQKLEAKGTSNIAQQCDVYRTKLLEAIEPKDVKEKKKKSSSHTSSPLDSKRKKSRSRSKSPSLKKRSRRSQSFESRSTSRSPARSRSRSPLATSLTSLKHYESRSPSPSSSRRSRSRSGSSSRGRGRSRSRSRSPSGKQKRKRSRSRSGTPVKKSSSRKKRSRSRSRSPSRKKSKKKKK